MIVKVMKNAAYEVKDGLYVWNGKGWDLQSELEKITKPRLLVKNGEVLWVDLPESQEEPKKEPTRRPTGVKINDQ